MDELPANWLSPLPLTGGGSLPNRIVPGPMEGVTVGSFCRVLAERQLVRCWIAPFIRLTTGVPRLGRLRQRLAPYLDTGLPVVAQVMGTDSALLAAARERLAQLGLLGVDLNCGCPSKTVVGNGSGGSLLRRPGWIKETLLQMRTVCPNEPLSIKLRTGFSSADEMPEILAAVREAAPDFVILHYRTVAEQYEPVTGGWERLARAKELLGDIPLLGSGDLFGVEDALRMWRETGVDGVAPARGLLRDPYLLLRIEQACAGRSTVPDRKLVLAVAADIARGSGERRKGRHGFVLEIIGGALGEDDPVFQQVAACAGVEEAGELLARLAAEADCARPASD